MHVMVVYQIQMVRRDPMRVLDDRLANRPEWVKIEWKVEKDILDNVLCMECRWKEKNETILPFRENNLC